MIEGRRKKYTEAKEDVGKERRHGRTEERMQLVARSK